MVHLSSARIISCSAITPPTKTIKPAMVLPSTHLKINSLKFIKFMRVKTNSSLKIRKIRANTCSISINNCSSNLKTNNNKIYNSLFKLKSKCPSTRIKRRSSWIKFMTIDSFIIIVTSFNNSNRNNSKPSSTSRPTLSNNRFKVREVKVGKEASRILITSFKSREWLLMMS